MSQYSSDAKEAPSFVNNHLTAQAKHAAKLSDPNSVLHSHESIAKKLEELKEIHLDGRLFVAVDLMEKMYASVKSDEVKDDTCDLVKELDAYPLIVDIRVKHNETLQM
ncbi:hypothetical protein RFI_08799 [Reticulomyxa filosa]|uniref:Uncharacterized protein n=1 Tax=Reticulomyxa filosa TaxID=46433 RepID=X6NQZ3_RETFI|nr:hypothetical protein RFI_08799 [Reticulomyxa filosa]|eukprot:ETO28338.1 hypothetical protein RFI_08799 [Reticulomyxa filosa]